MRPWTAALAMLAAAGASAAMPSSDPIQPGDDVVAASPCTAGFVVDGTGALAGNVYVLTASHCVSYVGQSAATTGHSAFATVVYMGDYGGETNGIAGIQADVALLKVKGSLESLVDGEVLGHPGTPSGTATVGGTAAGDRVLLSGHGFGFHLSAATREGRQGVLVDDSATLYRAAAPIAPGDSGGPVLHASGAALGLVSELAVDPLGGHVLFEGPTMEHILDELDAQGFPVMLRDG